MTARFDRSDLTVSRVAFDAGWEVWLLDVQGFPISSRRRGLARDFIDQFTKRACNSKDLSAEYFVQFTELHHEDGSRTFSDNGRRWLPQLGLGVWPDREAPRLWAFEEFRSLAPGESIRPLAHQVFRIAGGEEARRDARNTMFGIGAGVQVLSGSRDGELLKRFTDYLLPRIEEPSFRAYDFYVPLLAWKSLEHVHLSVLDDWLCGALLYMRESTEDDGLLIASAEPLVDFWRGMGLEPSGREHEETWTLSVH